MAETNEPKAAHQSYEDHENVAETLLTNIAEILSKLSIKKVYFVDDAIKLPIDKATFIGLVRTIIGENKMDQLRELSIQNALDLTLEDDILPEHIDSTWDNIKPRKQLSYYKKAYELVGEPQAINDLNVANNVKEFFADGVLICLTPNEWIDQRDAILQGLPEGERILVLFDQDLKLAGDPFTVTKGEDLILEVKNRNIPDKIIATLFTHTTTDIANELTDRQVICENGKGLSVVDFFLLSKSRLNKHDLFTDGIKKACLNTFCEVIKDRTITIIEEAQAKTIERLRTFDTYDFDHTVFKTSSTEGVWEPETLLRITDVLFKDNVRELMNDGNYVSQVNDTICSAKEVSNIEIAIKDAKPVPYNKKFELRHQELFESDKHLNELRRPIDNGDIFVITDGEKKNKHYILVAQECDMMVRGDNGKRGSESAIFLEIEKLSSEQLFTEMKRKYEGEIKKKKFANHFFADKYQLEYFERGTDKNGLVHFKKDIVIALNVLDLIVFNSTGEAVLDLNAPTYDKRFHNSAWQQRYELIKDEFEKYAQELDSHNGVLDAISNEFISEAQRNAIKAHLRHPFSFLEKVGILVNYSNRKFNFGIKRVGRLRLPKSKNLLDRYYQHLSRFAELHDFAGDTSSQGGYSKTPNQVKKVEASGQSEKASITKPPTPDVPSIIPE
ncbi:hypothetical protein [Deminuibacter soli]|uniref:Uncharacterized protein n=1 Tax=Deminuibacter soli TaxID=2291815 RepID=A0A3E1NH02_9BACT|nr:hypothetical protein [Deminuibacter soli]RFM27141.1 hypothetical protein DXN05_16915 [Deminuibacter soli]